MEGLMLNILFLILLLNPFSSCSPFPFDLSLPSKATFPLEQAEQLIRELNLTPKDAEIPVGPSYATTQIPEIVERQLRFPNFVGGTSISELGHHAGYINIKNSRAARMFYFFFESRKNQNDPVVLWLTGGPGCSSELAMFYENGPFAIAKNMSLVWNEYGWDKVSNIIYVDQPTGTGFSYSIDRRDIRHNELDVSNDLYDFLQAFFVEHPKFTKNDFYITGESYAGHYIPAITERIHLKNKEHLGVHINLKGFAIGNGLTNPAIQYKAYTDYAVDMGIINKTLHDRINLILPACELGIKLCGTDGVISCMASYVLCNSIFNTIMAHAGDINYYDVRKKCEGSICYDFSDMDKLLNQQNVRDALGVGDLEFVDCSPRVYKAMVMDWMRNLEVGIPTLLEDGIKMLVYAGEYDLICNWLGNFRWVNAMKWSGQEKFVSSPETPFMVDGSEAGVLKMHGLLSFLKVHDAGHMVPMDQPKAALEMLKKWTRGTLAAGDSGDLVAQM